MTSIVFRSIVCVTLLLWAALSIVLRGKSFEFDSIGARYSFHSVFAIYREIYTGIAVFGGLLAMVVDHGSVYRVVFALSSVYALFFVLWLTFQYEGYQHIRYRPSVNPNSPITYVGTSPYTGWKYAITLTAGVMSPLMFAVGLLGVAYGQ